jgi:hypothetical protein
MACCTGSHLLIELTQFACSATQRMHVVVQQAKVAADTPTLLFVDHIPAHAMQATAPYSKVSERKSRGSAQALTLPAALLP